MKRRSLVWKVYPYFALIILVSLTLSALYASREIRRLYIVEATSTLEARARIIEHQVDQLLLTTEPAALDRYCKETGLLSDTRVSVVDAEGVVIGDSHENPGIMENHGRRPEILRAFTGDVGVATRFSNTLQQSMLYVAVPIVRDAEIIGVVRVSRPVTAVGLALKRLYKKIALVGMALTLVVTIIGYVTIRRLTKPLKELQEGADRIAQGDFRSRLPIPDTLEIARLAESMNNMAAQLETRLLTIVQQRNEREAVLSSMSEALIVLDKEERIVSLNDSVVEYLNLNRQNVIGMTIYEAVRIPELHDIARRALVSGDPVEAEIYTHGNPDRYFQVHGTALAGPTGPRTGVVLVLTDISRIKKLENIRRDFVANVSHELKTPITAIKGSVESLLDGAMSNAEDSRRFLEMISRHAERLNHLVEDLLSLARIESESERRSDSLNRGEVAEVIKNSVQACRELSAGRQVAIHIECDSELWANMDQRQLEQAIINLIDNAVVNSQAGTEITVTAKTTDSEIIVSVTDQGCGIEARHLPRLFERFYRVDSGRSREAGGTGLGLAIVKHVAVAHGGRVSVESNPGQGSTFRIHLPMPV